MRRCRLRGGRGRQGGGEGVRAIKRVLPALGGSATGLCCSSLLPLAGGDYRADGSVGVELQAVYADFAVDAGAFFRGEVVLVDAVVDDVPFVRAGELQHGVVGGAVYFFLGVLDEDHGVTGYGDGA